eukprot:m.154534 g.154534  ORF g.154534 m.154534 type:complete len:956 (+) comp16390_c0_seq1:89-2956(+)
MAAVDNAVAFLSQLSPGELQRVLSQFPPASTPHNAVTADDEDDDEDDDAFLLVGDDNTAAESDVDEEESCSHAICNDPSFSSHVDQALVTKFIQCLCRHDHCAIKLVVKSNEQLFALLFGHVQSGKTDTFIMVALVLFLKYNLGTLAFLLNTASAYTAIADSVAAFNAKLTGYGLTPSEASKIAMTVATLQGQRGLSDHQMRRDVPAMYGRILRKTNITKGVQEGLKYVAKCGTDEDGRINALLIIDEAHNVVASQNSNLLGLERALHEDDLERYRPTMRDYMMVFYKKPDGSADFERIDNLLAKVDARGWQAKNLFKGILYVTATPTPIALTMATSTLQKINVVPGNNYYGYGDEVDQDRRIELKEEVVQGPSSRSMPDLIAKHPWVMDRMDEYMAPERGFQHILVYAGGKNDDRVDLARALAVEYRGVPMVAMCLYGNNRGFGSCLVFSEAAAGIANQLFAADKALHCNKSDHHVSVSGKKPAPGSNVMIRDGTIRRHRPPYGGHLQEAVDSNKAMWNLSAVVLHQGANVPIPTVRFVNSPQYRDRVLLDIVYKAAELAEISVEQLKIVGIGMQLLREGVTLKTTDHKLAPTAMLYAGSTTVDDVKLIQATGRIAGRQQGGPPPTLHAPKHLLDELKAAYARLSACNESIDAGYQAGIPPAVAVARREGVMALASADFLNPRNYNMAAIRNLIATQRDDVPGFHSLSAAESKEWIADAVDRVAREQGWTFPRQYLKAIGNCLPADSDYCCKEHGDDIDKWTRCDDCMLAIALRAVVNKMLTKRRSSKMELFYQAITVLGYYASAAGLSCVEGWPLDDTENPDGTPTPCWRDVAIGLGITERYSRTLIKQIASVGRAEPTLVPLRRLPNGLWAVKPGWWCYADTDGLGSIDKISVTSTELTSGLSLEDTSKLEAYLASLQPGAQAEMQTEADAIQAGSTVDRGEGAAKRAHRSP